MNRIAAGPNPLRERISESRPQANSQGQPVNQKGVIYH